MTVEEKLLFHLEEHLNEQRPVGLPFTAADVALSVDRATIVDRAYAADRAIKRSPLLLEEETEAAIRWVFGELPNKAEALAMLRGKVGR